VHSKRISAFPRELFAAFAFGNQTRIFGAGALKSEGPGGYFQQSSALAGENSKSINVAPVKRFITILIAALAKNAGSRAESEGAGADFSARGTL